MAPHQTYRRSAAASWTRIDLLLVVYDVGLETARRAREAAAIGDHAEVIRRQLKLQQVIVAILDGLDPAQREATERMQRLCLFMLERSQRGTPADWDAVQRILATLREGFAGIRDQAAELEARGVIPPAPGARYVDATA
jgi:flagellin-specific chaperone FliS